MWAVSPHASYDIINATFAFRIPSVGTQGNDMRNEWVGYCILSLRMPAAVTPPQFSNTFLVNQFSLVFVSYQSCTKGRSVLLGSAPRSPLSVHSRGLAHPKTAMPIAMRGSPPKLASEKLVFDPNRGGWVSETGIARPGQARQLPSNYEKPAERGEGSKHFENVHVGEWMLDMKREQALGLAPKDWSTSSQMNDPRPNGRAMFDARFYGNMMGRAAGGYSMMWDPTGVAAQAGKLKAAENMDSNFVAADMADETAAAAESAEKNRLGNNTNLSSFDSNEIVLAQMSQLQKQQMDGDGDGKLSAEELAKHGF
jgi:hypothetical protein